MRLRGAKKAVNRRYFPPHSDKDEICAYLDVSRETQDKLQTYVDLLVKWQQRINLVSSSTLPQVWQRHILDSAQLVPYLPASTQTVMDIGAGAGLPGLVLAMLTDKQIHLVESDTKKVAFMRTAIAETGVNAVIYHGRIEELACLQMDVITARALAPLSKLFELTRAQHHDGLRYLFLKGKGVKQELTELSSWSTLTVETYPSMTDEDAVIVQFINHK